ncbi:hypothetical protein F5Y19DRAFT_131289 [Xylariaceae sp. FL1651]|nr:hypothetical protein F5Y19DRAFT_131289 [Xylariaceae sp. FL1651]
MPDEEMEITVDFGQSGFGEDIDIDLDFPAGEPDEDMDLVDFDQVHDIQNFNSDTRDELMAEGDDASYGMIDTGESDHNASAAATNEIDIELGHTVGIIWQQNPARSASFNSSAEIDYIEEAVVENTDAQEIEVGVETSKWPQASTDPEDTDAMGHAEEAPFDFQNTTQTSPEELPLEGSSPSRREEYDDSKAVHIGTKDIDSTRIPTVADLDNAGNDIAGEGIDADDQASDKVSNTEQDEYKNQPDANANITSLHVTSQLEEPYELQETSYSGEAAEAEFDHIVSADAPYETVRQEHPDAIEPTDVDEDRSEHSQSEEADQRVTDLDTLEYQPGGESYTETADDQIDAGDDALVENPEISDTGSQPKESSPSPDLESHDNQVVTTADPEVSAVDVGDKDDPIQLADYYGVYISYGETDYSLFAKSEDDDPNQYFLSDRSALETPLAQFLASLREVVSEEISPLDELVMHVDGLGLEFSESTTLDFLGKYTFGDLVVLYDKLIKNDQAESSPPMYTYLMIKPNCNRRMMALGDSANTGRGLSEVALYRDSPSIEMEQANHAESHGTDLSVGGDYDSDESNPIYQLEDHEEGNTVKVDEGHNSPSNTIEAQLDHASNQNEEADEFDDNGSDGKFTDNPAEATEDDVDVSTYQDHATNEPSQLQPQDIGKQEQQPSKKTAESSASKPQTPLATTTNIATDAPNSGNTSVTATLDGEDQDEIDYNSDEDNESNNSGADGANLQEQTSRTTDDLEVSVNDEITWESENEETKSETRTASLKDTVQVSPVSGKRSRSDSDTLEGTGEENDNKRRRS